jgi:hypothetical protein
VSFTAHFNGLAIAPGVYGTANLKQSFRIGNSLIGVTNTQTHKTRIFWKGKLYATWPDSSGAPGRDTADGTYLTIEKGNPVLMSGPGYKNVPCSGRSGSPGAATTTTPRPGRSGSRGSPTSATAA